ncbi:metal-dependent hydrolase [Haloferax sp. DFSO52]|uniref:metal-dependent hydrolase n=1 Tax=Haloferax sp. DFSO52 TaxID=3388505 RepID=UPI003A879F95
MFPLGHLAFAYLSVVFVQRVRNRPLPSGWVIVAALFGSQLPDLIDKPLVYFGVLASGRSLGHSLLVAIPVLAVVLRLGYRAGYGDYAVALSVGVLSHYLGDSYRAFLAGDWYSTRYLLWPVFPAIDYPSDGVPPWVRAINSVSNPNHRVQWVLVVIALAVWGYDYYTRRQRLSNQ